MRVTDLCSLLAGIPDLAKIRHPPLLWHLTLLVQEV